jgi:hypothetical protein
MGVASLPGECNRYTVTIVSFAEHSKIFRFVASTDGEWLHMINF